MSETRNARRVLQGVVASAKMDKTIAVRVERTFAHPKYGKFVRSHKQYIAHDEQNSAQEGDTVEIIGTRPLSKTKRWRLSRIVETSALGGAAPTAAEKGNEFVTEATAEDTAGGEA
jgi:small subunit ribosomal protein S17